MRCVYSSISEESKRQLNMRELNLEEQHIDLGYYSHSFNIRPSRGGFISSRLDGQRRRKGHARMRYVCL